MSKEIALKETGRLLMQANSFVLCTHVSPDGDTLGSTLGLARVLRAQGKDVVVLCDDEIGSGLAFMPGIEMVRRPVESERIACELLVVIDASSFDRVGLVSELVDYDALLNIDHHISNTRFADYLYLDAKAAAVGEIMCDLFQTMEWRIDVETAECFYIAISTDCGSFSYENTTAKTMRAGAWLLEHGVKTNKISDRLSVKSRLTIEKLAQVLPTLSFDSDGKIAYLCISNDIYDKEANTDSFVSFPRCIEGVEIAFMLKAVEPETVRVSMRSHNVDVARVAVHFGGGGHLRAAGCTIHASLEEARELLLAELRKLL
jgi:phosphoesterase RecJ-like protein